MTFFSFFYIFEICCSEARKNFQKCTDDSLFDSEKIDENDLNKMVDNYNIMKPSSNINPSYLADLNDNYESKTIPIESNPKTFSDDRNRDTQCEEFDFLKNSIVNPSINDTNSTKFTNENCKNKVLDLADEIYTDFYSSKKYHKILLEDSEMSTYFLPEYSNPDIIAGIYVKEPGIDSYNPFLNIKSNEHASTIIQELDPFLNFHTEYLSKEEEMEIIDEYLNENLENLNYSEMAEFSLGKDDQNFSNYNMHTKRPEEIKNESSHNTIKEIDSNINNEQCNDYFLSSICNLDNLNNNIQDDNLYPNILDRSTTHGQNNLENKISEKKTNNKVKKLKKSVRFKNIHKNHKNYNKESNIKKLITEKNQPEHVLSTIKNIHIPNSNNFPLKFANFSRNQDNKEKININKTEKLQNNLETKKNYKKGDKNLKKQHDSIIMPEKNSKCLFQKKSDSSVTNKGIKGPLDDKYVNPEIKK